MKYIEYGDILIPSKSTEIDGVTVIDKPTESDDSDLIQNALYNGAGGIVVLPPKTYKVSKTLYVPENTTFLGFGLESKIELIDSSNLDTIPFRTHTSTTNDIKPILTNERPNGILKTKGVQVKNIHITGKGVVENTDIRLGGIIFADAENCRAEMVFVDYINWSEEHNVEKKGYGLACVRSTNCTFNKGMLDHAGYECFGIYDDCKNITAMNMLIKNGMRCSAQIHQNVSGVIFVNNTLLLDEGGTYTNGCFVMHGRENAIIEDIIISNNYLKTTVPNTNGIGTVEYQTDVSIHDNVIVSEGRGIWQTGLNFDFSIKNNRIKSKGLSISVGHSLLGTSSITGNKIKSDVGAVHINRCDALDLSGNGIESDGYGIRVDLINKGVIIDKNIINANEAFYDDYENREKVLIGQNLIT